MIVVRGLGWVHPAGYGSLMRSLAGTSEPPRDAAFRLPFRNFGRLDRVSRMTCWAAGLAIADAGMAYPVAPGTNVGIAGTSERGCLDSDLAYFRDYLAGGRTLGRGNLFIYTLPSSPLAEAAIHFGLTGPLVHVRPPDGRRTGILEAAALALDDTGIDAMVAGDVGSDSAVFAVLARSPEGVIGGAMELATLVRALAGGATLADAIAALPNPGKEEGK
jgi:3-oxoacyl-[acyl-carrier-protein] synthase II